MTNRKVIPLLALALEGLEKAKTVFVRRLWAHFATLGFSIISVAAASVKEHDDYRAVEIGAAILAVLTELAAFAFHHRATHFHSLGRMVMRRVMLTDAEKPEDAPKYFEFIEGRFSKDVRDRAAARERDDPNHREEERLENYYFSTRKTGPKRLRDHLLESAIFSQKLYASAWWFSLIVLAVLSLLALTVMVLVAWPFQPQGFDTAGLVLRLVVIFVSFLPLSQELDHLLLYKQMAESLEDLLERLRKLYSTPLTEEELKLRLTADFGDYGACTTFAPPIRSYVYHRNVKRLRDEFKAEMEQLSEQEAKLPPAG